MRFAATVSDCSHLPKVHNILTPVFLCAYASPDCICRENKTYVYYYHLDCQAYSLSVRTSGILLPDISDGDFIISSTQDMYPKYSKSKALPIFD